MGAALYTDDDDDVAFGAGGLVRLDLPPHAAEVHWHTKRAPPAVSARRMCSRVRMYANVEVDAGGTLRGAHAPPLLDYVLVRIGTQWHGYDHADVYAKRGDERALGLLVPKAAVGAARAAAVRALAETAERVNTLRGQLNAACATTPLDEVHAAFYAQYIEPGVEAPEDALVYEQLMHVAAKDDARGAAAPRGPEHGARVREVRSKGTFGWLGEARRLMSTCVAIVVCVFLRFLSVVCEDRHAKESWTLLVLKEMVLCAMAAAGAAGAARALSSAGARLGEYARGLLERYTPYAAFVHAKGGGVSAVKCAIRMAVPLVVNSFFPVLSFLPPPFNVSLVPLAQQAVDQLIGAEHVAPWCSALDSVGLIARELGFTWGGDVVGQIGAFARSASAFVGAPLEALEAIAGSPDALERAFTIVRNAASAAGIAVPWPGGASGVLASWAAFGALAAVIAYQAPKALPHTMLSVMFDRWARLGVWHFAPSAARTILACNLAHPVEAGKAKAAEERRALDIGDTEYAAMQAFFGPEWARLVTQRGITDAYADFAVGTILGSSQYDAGALGTPEARELRRAIGAAVAAGREHGDERALLPLLTNARVVGFVAQRRGEIGKDVLRGVFKDEKTARKAVALASLVVDATAYGPKPPPGVVGERAGEVARMLGVKSARELEEVAAALARSPQDEGALKRARAFAPGGAESRMLALLGLLPRENGSEPTGPTPTGPKPPPPPSTDRAEWFGKLARGELTVEEIDKIEAMLVGERGKKRVSEADDEALERRLLALRIKAKGGEKLGEELGDRIDKYVANHVSEEKRKHAREALLREADTLGEITESDAVEAARVVLATGGNPAESDTVRMYAAIRALSGDARWSRTGPMGMVAAAIAARNVRDASARDSSEGTAEEVPVEEVFADADSIADGEVLDHKNLGSVPGLEPLDELLAKDKALVGEYEATQDTERKKQIAAERDTLAKLVRYAAGETVDIDASRLGKLTAAATAGGTGPTGPPPTGPAPTKATGAEGADAWKKRLEDQRKRAEGLPQRANIRLWLNDDMLVWDKGYTLPRSLMRRGEGSIMNLDKSKDEFSVMYTGKEPSGDEADRAQSARSVGAEMRALLDHDRKLAAKLQSASESEAAALKEQRRTIAQWVLYGVGQRDAPSVGLEGAFSARAERTGTSEATATPERGPEPAGSEPAGPEAGDTTRRVVLESNISKALSALGKILNAKLGQVQNNLDFNPEQDAFTEYLEARANFIEAAAAGKGEIERELDRLIPKTKDDLLFERTARVDLSGKPAVVAHPGLLYDQLAKVDAAAKKLEAAAQADAEHQWQVARDNDSDAPAVPVDDAKRQARLQALEEYRSALFWLNHKADGVQSGGEADESVRKKLNEIESVRSRITKQLDVENAPLQEQPGYLWGVKKESRASTAKKYGWSIAHNGSTQYPDEHATLDLGKLRRNKAAPAGGPSAGEGAAAGGASAREGASGASAGEGASGLFSGLASAASAVGAGASGLVEGAAGAALGAAGAALDAAARVADAVGGAVAPSEERVIAWDVGASGAAREAKEAVLAVLRGIKGDTSPAERIRKLDAARKLAASHQIALREYWRGPVAVAPWVEPQKAAATEERLRAAPRVRASKEVGPRVLVIGTYRGRPTQRGVVAVHAHGAVASVGARQDPPFWHALGAELARAYAPMVVAPLAAVVVADDAVDAGASVATRLLDATGVSVVRLAAHCGATPPDAEMHAVGAFAAGSPPEAYVLSTRGRARARKVALYERRIDRNASHAARAAFAAEVRRAHFWAEALETVVDAIVRGRV
jgi:hypothetical protein